MAQDFAKKRKPERARSTTSARKRTNTGRSVPAPAKVWRWYGAGVISGILLCLFFYLRTLPADSGDASQGPQANVTSSATVEEPPKPRFDFYTLLPEQTMEVEVDPGETARNRTNASTELYVLQAGAFRERQDADRRRAELLLLGLEPRVEETHGDNGRWFRVYVGPFESRSRVSRARSLTAAQNIDTMLLKRSKP